MMGDFFGVGNSGLPKSNCTAATATTLDETGCSEVSTTVGNADKDDTNSSGRLIISSPETESCLLSKENKAAGAIRAYFVLSFRKGRRWHRR